jgi:hypothetical protein
MDRKHSLLLGSIVQVVTGGISGNVSDAEQPESMRQVVMDGLS